MMIYEMLFSAQANSEWSGCKLCEYKTYRQRQRIYNAPVVNSRDSDQCCIYLPVECTSLCYSKVMGKLVYDFQLRLKGCKYNIVL